MSVSDRNRLGPRRQKSICSFSVDESSANLEAASLANWRWVWLRLAPPPRALRRVLSATKAEAGEQGEAALEARGVVGARVGMNEGVSPLEGLATAGLHDPPSALTTGRPTEELAFSPPLRPRTRPSREAGKVRRTKVEPSGPPKRMRAPFLTLWGMAVAFFSPCLGVGLSTLTPSTKVP